MDLKKIFLFLVLIMNTLIINAQTIYYGDAITNEIKIAVTIAQNEIYVKGTNSNNQVFMKLSAKHDPNSDCTFMSDDDMNRIIFSNNYNIASVVLNGRLDFCVLVSIDNDNTTLNPRESREINSNQNSNNDRITIEYLLKNEQEILNRLESEKSLFDKSLFYYKHLELIKQSKQRILDYQQRLRQLK